MINSTPLPTVGLSNQSSLGGGVLLSGASMSRTVMADVNGFTPVIDTLVKEVGLLTATVFGVVWRHCQMEDGFCWASQEKLADIIGISRQTMNEHIKKLSTTGYLEEVGYGTNGVVKLFDTGKANLKFSVSGVVQTDSRCRPNRQPPVVQTDTKIVIKKEKETNISDLPEPIREECDLDGITESMELGYGLKKKKSYLTEEEKQLAEVFSSIAGVKVPVSVTKRDYGEYTVTWWKPIKEMLRQVDGNFVRAGQLIEQAIEKQRKSGLPVGMPKSILNSYMGELSMNSRRMAKDADGNWREL